MTVTYNNLGKVGRLGNALFELASTIGIADTTGQPFAVPTDWIHRKYFSIPMACYGDDPRNFPGAPWNGAGPPDPIEATEYATHIDIRARQYLQDIHLFWPSIDKIREFFQPSEYAQEVLSHFELPEGPRIGVHVRRGDNVFDPGVANKADYHSCPSIDFYRQGIAMQPEGNLVVISDDIPWCREQFPDAAFFGDGQSYWKEHEARFGIDEPSDWIDLFLLAQCDYYVISGSTFGIWGAILGNVPHGHVVRPDKVYGPLVSHVDESLLFHPSWRVLTSC